MSGVKGKSGVYKRTELHREAMRLAHPKRLPFCKNCGVNMVNKGKNLFCSNKCRGEKMPSKGLTGMKRPTFSAEWLKKLSESHKGQRMSEENKRKMSIRFSGSGNPAYIKDRSKIKAQENRGNPLYFEWRKSVWVRDDWKCKMKNQDCSGRLEVHHILRWADYPELRYDINNGVTLCHYHHPRQREEEVKLQSEFIKLITYQI